MQNSQIFLQLTWAVVHEVDDFGIIWADTASTDSVCKSRIFRNDNRFAILRPGQFSVMHGGIIVVRNPAVVDVVFDGEITAIDIGSKIVVVDSDVSVSVGSVLFVMKTNGVTELVDYPILGTKSLKHANPLMLRESDQIKTVGV